MDSSVNDPEFLDASYTVYRTDRNANNSTKARGGGVLLAVKNSLKANLLSIGDPSIEEVWVSITIGDLVYCVGCVYVPPLMDTSCYELHLKSVSSACDRFENVLLVGDYNLSQITWSPGEDYLGLLPGNVRSAKEILLCDTFAFLGLSQFNYILNENNSILDLCFANFDVKIKKSVGLVNCDLYHPALLLSIKCKKTNYLKAANSFFYDFKSADFDLMNNYFLSYDWLSILNDDLEITINNFYSVAFNCFDLFVPTKQCCPNDRFPIWFSNKLKFLILQKKYAHKRYKQSNTVEDYNTFSLLRRQCLSLSKECYSLYIANTENSIKENVRSFWHFVRSQSDHGSIPKEMCFGTNKADNGHDTANLFAQFFSSVYNPITNCNASDVFNKFQAISDIRITPSDIEKSLSELDMNKGEGPDGIPNRVLKLCSHSLYLPLYHIFSKSLTSGVFPKVWKLSYVCPIHKSGSKNEVTNYRPISILSAIPKLFEHCIEKVLSAAFNQIIVNQQHGFTSGRSVDTNLFLFTNFIHASFEKGCETHTIYTDFSKAFDKVSHTLLLSKLSGYGVAGTLLSWLESYLSGRVQRVKIDTYLSDEFDVTSGVPQGSHLGPLLFSLFVNDLGNLLSSNFLMFADDLKIFREVSSTHDILLLQNDLNIVYDWCKLNDMSLNVDKCCFMRFTRLVNSMPTEYSINNVTLTEVFVVRDLGVYLDTKLVFTEHIEKIISRANRMLGFIKRASKDFKGVFALKVLYTSLVRSILDFSNIVWSPYYQIHINRLENVQLKFIKYAKYKLFCNGIELDNGQTMLYLDLASLVRRRQYYDICFAFNVLNHFIKSPECLQTFRIRIPGYPTRGQALLHIPNCRSWYLLYSPVNRVSASVNKFCEALDFFNVSPGKFKRCAKRAVLG